MSRVMTRSLVYRIPIGINIHKQAEEFSLHQGNFEKAKQVYLNTLTVWSVKTYINILGWQTSLENSDSWNPVLQSLMNVADLDILNCGKLECIRTESKTDRGTPVTAGTVVLRRCNGDWINVPAEVRLGRIAYIVVELNQSLREAKILGFVNKLNDGQIFLSNIQSIEEFPAYLEQQRNKQLLALSKPVKLSQWIEGVFECSWRKPDKSALPSKAINFCSTSQLTVSKIDSLTNDFGITRVKLIDLDSNSIIRQIALLLNVKSQKNGEIEISVKVSPTYICTHLPDELEIMVLDEKEKKMMKAQAKQTQSIEFRFNGKIEDKFSIKVVLNNFSKVENFII